MEQNSQTENSRKRTVRKAMGFAMKTAVPLCVTVGLCWIMFRQVSVGAIVEQVRSGCNLWVIAAMLATGLLPVLFRAMRWRLQLRAIGVDVPLRVLFYSIFGTYSVNLVFPRLGEVWRTGYIAQRQKASFAEVFGSMVADRVADLITVGLLTFFTFTLAAGKLREFVAAYPGAYRFMAALLTSPWFWAGAAAATAGGWALLFRCNRGPLPKIRGFMIKLWQGFAALGHMKGKGRWLLLTVAIWGFYFLQLVVAFHAFPQTLQLLAEGGLIVPLVCFTLTSITMGIPSQGGIGPYQIAMRFGLLLFWGKDCAPALQTLAVTFGNVIMAAQTLFLIVGGIVVFALIALDRKHNRQD